MYKIKCKDWRENTMLTEMRLEECELDCALIGKRVRTARKAKKVTQEELSEHCGCTPTHICNLENGKIGVSLELLFKISIYLARTFENQISGGLKSTSQGISKSNANDNYINNTYFSDTESIFSERAEPMGERMRQRERYKEMVLENIDYDILKEEPKLDREQLDEIVELMVDTICTTQEYIIIGGDKKPAEVVKSQFLKLDAGHIQFVLDCLKENTSKVRNIRKYLLSVLYNASMTIDNYYSALVNHDLYGG